MSVIIEKSGPILVDDDVVALENRIGFALPKPYRNFLLRYNGGQPTPDMFDVPGHPESSFRVHIFWGINRSIEANQIEWNRVVFADRIPLELLGIGGTDTGDRICLDCQIDRMWFWDSMAESTCLWPINCDFAEFLQRLRVKDAKS